MIGNDVYIAPLYEGKEWMNEYQSKAEMASLPYYNRSE